MKRVLALFLALLMLPALCSCGKDEAQRTPEDSGQETDENMYETEVAAEAQELPEIEADAFAEEDADIGPAADDLPAEEVEDLNTRSVRRLRCGDVTHSGQGGFRSAIRQGDTIYLAYNEKLAKMPVGGDENDAEVLLDWEFTNHNWILEIQVVGGWIYIRTDEGGNSLYNINSLWRVRTDGTDLERLTNILAEDDKARNTFAVIDDRIYLPYLVGEQLSATEFKYTSILYCYQPDTGAMTELYRTTSNRSRMNLIITSYNERSLLLLDFSKDEKQPTLLIYEYGADAPFVAPEALQEMMLAEKYYYCVFYDDMTNTGSYLAENNEILYRISPDNGYIPEKLPAALFTEEEAVTYAQNRIIYELLVLDDETFVYSYWVQGLGKGMRIYRNGTLTNINGDKGTHLDYPGDGYLYYSYPDQWGHFHHYRVRLDGTGWEQLDWEYR